MENVAIIGGTGDQGYGLALRWALAGFPIVIGSRDAARAQSTAARLREEVARINGTEPAVSGAENAAAAADAPVVVIAVPLAAQAATAKSIKDALRPGAVVIDVTLPLATAIGGRASRMLGLPAGSAALQLAEYLPAQVRVTSGFHFLSAELLADPGVSLDCDVVCCGGDQAAQEVLRTLSEALPGVRYVHAGALASSALIEAAATMLIAINVRNKSRQGGMRITGIDLGPRA